METTSTTTIQRKLGKDIRKCLQQSTGSHIRLPTVVITGHKHENTTPYTQHLLSNAKNKQLPKQIITKTNELGEKYTKRTITSMFKTTKRVKRLQPHTTTTLISKHITNNQTQSSNCHSMISPIVSCHNTSTVTTPQGPPLTPPRHSDITTNHFTHLHYNASLTIPIATQLTPIHPLHVQQFTNHAFPFLTHHREQCIWNLLQTFQHKLSLYVYEHLLQDEAR